MKAYVNPELEVISFEEKDIIATSDAADAYTFSQFFNVDGEN